MSREKDLEGRSSCGRHFKRHRNGYQFLVKAVFRLDKK